MTWSRILLTSALVLGCGDPLPPAMQVAVAARMLTPAVAVDDTIRVRVVAINRTSHAVSFQTGSCHFFLIVYDAANREVDRSRPMCTQEVVDLTIPAHDSAFQVIALRIHDYDGSGLVPPQPGNYRVRATLSLVSGSVWSDAVPLRIE